MSINVFNAIVINYYDIATIHYNIAGHTEIDLTTWVDEALNAFHGVKDALYKDLATKQIAEVYEDLVYQLVENSKQNVHKECIYTVWSLSKYFSFF